MISDAVTSAIMISGMKCLVEKLGIIEAEMFISVIRESTFDYTEWRQNNLWQDMSIDEVLDLAADRENKRKKIERR